MREHNDLYLEICVRTVSCLWCPSPLWSHKGWEHTKQNVGVQAIRQARPCPPLNQQRGHVCIKESVCVCVSMCEVVIAITWRQKCQATLVIRESSEVAMTSLTSTILPRPLTLCNLSMFKQTLSGSWKYKCQVFPHENSCDLDPGGNDGPDVCFFFQLTFWFPIPSFPPPVSHAFLSSAHLYLSFPCALSLPMSAM